MRKAPLILLALLAAAPGAARDRNRVPEATFAGEPESCIPLRSIRQSHVRGDGVIDFEMTGGRVYRNVLPNGCPGLGFNESFAYQTSLSQLCSTDIITVLQQTAGLQRGASWPRPVPARRTRETAALKRLAPTARLCYALITGTRSSAG